MPQNPVKLDMTTSVPISGGVKLDMSTSTPLSAAPAQAPSYDPTMPADVAARHARSRNPNVDYGDPNAPKAPLLSGQGLQEVGEGFAKNLAKIPIGIAAAGVNLANVGAPDELKIPVPNIPELEPQEGTNEGIGAIGGEIAQVLGGTQLLKVLGTTAYLQAKAPQLIQLLQNSPKAVQLIAKLMATTGVEGAIVGGTMGAIEGAPKEKTLEGAAGGAASGMLANVAGEGMLAAAPKVVKGTAKLLGLGGLKPEEQILKAAGGSASVIERRFLENAKRALPRIAEENPTISILGHEAPAQFAEAAHSAKTKLWNNYTSDIATAAAANPRKVINGDSVAREIKNEVDDELRNHFPDITAKIDEWADTFRGPISLESAGAKISLFNKMARDFYTLSPSEQKVMAAQSPKMGMLDDAADALRGRLDQALSSVGVKDTANIRKDYGALNQMQRVFEKRAVVYGRQQPMDLKSAIGYVAGLSGHPVAATIGPAGKFINSPGHLMRSAISKTKPGVVRKTGQAIKSGVDKAADVAGKPLITTGGINLGEDVAEELTAPDEATESEPIASNVDPDGDGWVAVRYNGQELLIHPEDLAEAQSRQPDLEIIG